ncbi:hypothetical protein ACHAXA_004202 [Cyclostephanos tholiformis]|uniref:SET domain-containing protein n=1 Tax=Cyclostephanos tholiformis TaxID=382380 RepID=A0ABD3RRV4_9STRA
MKASLLLFASSIGRNSDKDAIFNAWCSEVGISCPGAEVRSSSESVAGRGVFSTKDLSIGEEVISIPHYAALTQYNCAAYFPDLERELSSVRDKGNTKRSYLKRIWHRMKRRPTSEKSNDDETWPAELTAYALEAIETEHPWSTWISQWKRDDPLQNLVDISSWRNDDAIRVAVADFHKMAPAVPECKIGAALGIRLHELEVYSSRYTNKVPTSESLYCTLMSRAVGLSDSVAAVLPMHDMINHSPNPNLGLAFAEDETFKLIALENIPKDSELFLSYKTVIDDNGKWDEDKACWLLVHWGIPSSQSEMSQVTDHAFYKNVMSLR